MLLPDSAKVLFVRLTVPAKLPPAPVPNENAWLLLDAFSVPAPVSALSKLKAPAVLAFTVPPAAISTPPAPKLSVLLVAVFATASVPVPATFQSPV
ncbi:hypothetical protein DP49_7051 [Burkholderia pseudomallei]|nr:hypothetical protein DP49_7051 [Burkholderia pseudomallei]